MNLSHPLREEWSLTDLSQSIVNQLQSYKAADLQKLLKLSDQQLEENMAYIQAFDQPTTYRALEMYDGLAYRQLDREKYGQKEWDYLNNHLTILSALYGPISANQKIKAYRLDFTMPIKLDGKSLKALWKAHIQDHFKPGAPLVNLASQEFSSLLKPDDYHWIDVDFYKIKADGQVSRHSTLGKKGRGLLLNDMVTRGIEDLNELKDFDTDGFVYDANQSTDQLFSFRQEES